MSYGALLLAIATVHLAGNLSPGPNLVLVGETSAGKSRATGLLVGLGLTAGAGIWAAAAAVSLGLLSYLSWLQQLLRILGGIYLIYLGWRLMCGTQGASTSQAAQPGWYAFRTGLLVSLANPYCLIFFGGAFAALLPAGSPAWFRAAAVAVIIVDALLWYSVLAFVFSIDKVRSIYDCARSWLSRIMGGLLMVFGMRLIYSAR